MELVQSVCTWPLASPCLIGEQSALGECISGVSVVCVCMCARVCVCMSVHVTIFMGSSGMGYVNSGMEGYRAALTNTWEMLL